MILLQTKAVSYFYLGSLDMREGNTAAAAPNFNKGKEANPQLWLQLM